MKFRRTAGRGEFGVRGGRLDKRATRGSNKGGTESQRYYNSRLFFKVSIGKDCFHA